MIKKGNRAADVANDSMIETLIVWSEDLVQVVAKAFPIPSTGVSECVRRVGLDDIAGINECLERKAKANETNGNNKMWIMRFPLPRKYILIGRMVQWITPETALNHEWLHEVHFPNFKEFMLTFPSQHAKDRSCDLVNMKFFIMNI
ncbi:unnamed protein product [Fraxinus pennsylvanica]|uniref:Uncharacterized protein n=1 Tax=Fraxinus pennsylvanica TaxID=56036 RepID=A0AAD1YTZ8_9LAMI|nr:unnamed protein product [Fraxinus pennsylvanica]